MNASPAQATVPLFHRFLGIGLVLMLVTAVVLKVAGVVPMLPPADATFVIAYTFAGIAGVMIVVALLVFRPRVSGRQPAQSVEQFWTTQAIVTKIMPVWFLLEGAGVFAIVGYFMTGETIAVAASFVAVSAFWLYGPNALAKGDGR